MGSGGSSPKEEKVDVDPFLASRTGYSWGRAERAELEHPITIGEPSSGIDCTDESVEAFNELKLKHTYKYIVYAMDAAWGTAVDRGSSGRAWQSESWSRLASTRVYTEPTISIPPGTSVSEAVSMLWPMYVNMGRIRPFKVFWANMGAYGPYDFMNIDLAGWSKVSHANMGADGPYDYMNIAIPETSTVVTWPNMGGDGPYEYRAQASVDEVDDTPIKASVQPEDLTGVAIEMSKEQLDAFKPFDIEKAKCRAYKNRAAFLEIAAQVAQEGITQGPRT